MTTYPRPITRRTALAHALPLYGYDRRRATAALWRQPDGRYLVRYDLPWAAVATIPMPTRQPPLTMVMGASGAQCTEREWLASSMSEYPTHAAP